MAAVATNNIIKSIGGFAKETRAEYLGLVKTLTLNEDQGT